jgi:RNA polymerase sigma-70 factor, ECF subfamily
VNPSAPQLALSPDDFERLYALTARPLKAYLLRLVPNAALADELLQEAYYRFLRSDAGKLAEREQRAYLFRIAANLATDTYRSHAEKAQALPDEERNLPARRPAALSGESEDVRRMLAQLNPRERELVWMAYVEGSSHREIAQSIGVREGSIRPMLFRAKQKLLTLLKGIGYGSAMRT